MRARIYLLRRRALGPVSDIYIRKCARGRAGYACTVLRRLTAKAVREVGSRVYVRLLYLQGTPGVVGV